MTMRTQTMPDWAVAAQLAEGPTYGGTRRGTGRIAIRPTPSRRTFQDFVPDYAQAAGASRLPSRAATVAPRPAVQNTVPDHVQAARMAAARATVPAHEAPLPNQMDIAAGFDIGRMVEDPGVRDLDPVTQYEVAPPRRRQLPYPIGMAPPRRQTLPYPTPEPSLSWREFVSEDPLGPRRPQPPRFSINAGGLPVPFAPSLAAEPWPYGRFENLQRGGLAAPVPNRFRGLGFDEWYRQLTLPHSAYRSAVWEPMGPVGNTGVPWGV